jgi:hypothetical protein
MPCATFHDHDMTIADATTAVDTEAELVGWAASLGEQVAQQASRHDRDGTFVDDAYVVPACRRAEPDREGIRQPPASVEGDRPAPDSLTKRFPPEEPTLDVARTPVHHQIRFVARIDSTRRRPDRSEYQPVPGGRLRGAHLDHRLGRRQLIELHRLTHPESQSGGIELLRGRITEGPPHRPLAGGELCPVEVPTGRGQRVLDDLAIIRNCRRIGLISCIALAAAPGLAQLC